MSDNGAKKIPPGVLTMLREAQLRVQLAQEKFDHLVTRVEAQFGVRLHNSQVTDDGTVVEAAAPEAGG